MLQQFNFENFRSFRDEMSLDLSAAKISELESTVIIEGNDKLLPVIAIYGANASGKSNVLSAFNAMCYFVRNSMYFAADNIKDIFFSEHANARANFDDYYRPFVFDDESANAPSEFEVFYTDKNGKTVNYGFSIDRDGVAEEWLFITAKSRGSKPKQIIKRDRDEGILEFSGIPKKAVENLRIAVSSYSLALSMGAVLNIELLKSVFSWFGTVRFIDFGNILDQLKLITSIPGGLLEDESMRSRLTRYLASFDKSIVGVSLKKIEGDEDKVKIDILHHMADGDNVVALPLADESDGTKKMFYLFGHLDSLLSTGSVIVIDELNAKLHPLLVRHLLTLFLDKKNSKHAQIIFTCHDAWLLKSGILRRDEIWFTEKSDKGLSNLYSLADFVDEDGYKIRKDADYEKNYLLGKYGAIPTLESLDMFMERTDEGVITDD